MPRQQKSLAQSFSGMKAEYAGMTESRFRRRRQGVGGVGLPGDAHAEPESRFIKMREYSRAMVRDDAAAKFLIERAVDNIIGRGYRYEPDTGDEKIDLDLWQRQEAWAKDPQACDVAGEMTFAEMEWLVAFSEYVDGDVFLVGTDEGQLQVYEADRCCTPTRSTRNVVHGIELDGRGRHRAYFFKKYTPGERLKYQLVRDFHEVPAYDEEGYKQVWQVCRPHRFTQARGLVAFHPIFDKAGMLEDIDFALLVKQQFAAMVAWFLKRTDAYSGDLQTGARTEERQADGTTQLLEEIAPGTFVRGAKGEELELKAANIPSSETMAHLRHTLQIISLNLGLPLFVATMDPSEGSFSAWRGALDQAKKGFTRNQDRYEARLHRHVITFNVRRWIAEDRALRRAAENPKLNLFGHTWHKPRWPYIDPAKDAAADTTKIENYLADPYEVLAEQGRDADVVRDRTIKFNKGCIVAAIEAAKQIKTESGVEVHWRDVYNRAVPKGGQLFDQVEEENTVGGRKSSGVKQGVE